MKQLLCLFLTGLFAIASAADARLLALVDPQAKMVAGIHAERVKASNIGQMMVRKITVDDQDFTRFIQETGFDPRYDVSEIVFASTPLSSGNETGLVACRGTFQPARILSAARSRGGSASFYKGVELWTNDQGRESLAILDNTIAVFGNTTWVKTAIDRRAGTVGLTADLVGRINALSATNDMWFYSAAAFPKSNGNRSGINIDSIEQFWGGMKFGQLVSVRVEAFARSSQDAQALVDVGRFLLQMVRGNARDLPASVRRTLEEAQLLAQGNVTSLNMSMPEQQLLELIEMAPSRSSHRSREAQ
jgi:hypothetical protein